MTLGRWVKMLGWGVFVGHQQNPLVNMGAWNSTSSHSSYWTNVSRLTFVYQQLCWAFWGTEINRTQTQLSWDFKSLRRYFSNCEIEGGTLLDQWARLGQGPEICMISQVRGDSDVLGEWIPPEKHFSRIYEMLFVADNKTLWEERNHKGKHRRTLWKLCLCYHFKLGSFFLF